MIRHSNTTLKYRWG